MPTSLRIWSSKDVKSWQKKRRFLMPILNTLPFRAETGDGRQYPGRRFALPWARCRLPFQGVLQPPRFMRALLFRFPLGLPQPILTPNSLLTRCKQRAVHYLTMRTNSLLTPCKQRVVHYLAMRTNSLLTSQSLGKQGAVLSRYPQLLTPNS